jgi:glycosyltransferase involved in cell wall biosynthesis
LWQSGSLGGRSYDVLMTRLPMSVLQQRLDQVHSNYPQSSTLADFRSPANLINAEEQALQEARSIITPHVEIAALFPQKAILLDWHLPIVNPPPRSGKRILFPASTLGRKGAYELRAAAQELNLEITVLGREFEGIDFWQGVTVHSALDAALDEVGLVILPAHIEHQPRVLLRAIAAGIPVIASAACGLGNLPGVTTVPTGDIAALKAAINLIQTDERSP